MKRANSVLGKRIAGYQSGIMVVVAFILILASFLGFLFISIKTYSNKAEDIVRLIADQIEWERLEPYALSGVDDEYSLRLKDYMDAVKTNYKDLAFLYIFIPGDNSFVYVYDAKKPTDDLEMIDGYGSLFYYTDTEYDNLLPDVKAKCASDKIHLVDSGMGLGVEVWAPVLDKNGDLQAMVEADYRITDIYASLAGAVGFSALVVVVCIMAANLIFQNYIYNKVSRPLVRLNDAVDSYEHGKMDLDVDSFIERDELRHLAESFEAMTKRIELYNEEVAKISAEKERIGAELNIATKIQEDMLPRIFPPFPDKPEIDVYAIMNPAKEVGGDFYDFFWVDDDHIAMVIADVSSKGVPAALFMVISKTLIKNQTMSGASIAEVFANVNNQLCEGNEESMFVTSFMAVVNIRTGEMEYVNAGHEPFLHRNKGKWKWVRPETCFILAGLPDIEYKSAKMQLEPGDRIFMFTDGVSEAQNLNHDLYGEENIYESIVKRGDTGLKRMLSDMRKDIDTFVGKADQFDDITMLVFEYRNKAE